MAAEEAQGDEDEDEEDICAPLPKIDYPSGVAALIERVLHAVHEVDGAAVYAFGSAVNGFGDAASDVDLVLAAAKASLVKGLDLGKVSNRDLAPRSLAKLHSRLRKEGFRIRERVLGARVPVLKMTLKAMECDLSVNNLLPVFNTLLLKAYADIDSRAVDLTRECKAWAKAQGVHGAPFGHLSSYAFTLMVIFYMQVRGALPCLQSRATERPCVYREGGKSWNVAMDDPQEALVDWNASNKASSVSLSLQDFARFYSEEFQWGKWVVSVRTGKCSSVAEYPQLNMKVRDGVSSNEWAEFIHIEDPIDVARNLNCVLAPRHNMRLWWAIVDATKKGNYGRIGRQAWNGGAQASGDQGPAGSSNSGGYGGANDDASASSAGGRRVWYSGGGGGYNDGASGGAHRRGGGWGASGGGAARGRDGQGRRVLW